MSPPKLRNRTEIRNNVSQLPSTCRNPWEKKTGMLATSPCEHVLDTLGSLLCLSPASVGIWDLAAGIWLFEVTFADPCQFSFKVFHLSSSVTQKLKSSILVCLFSGISGHLFSLMYLNLILDWFWLGQR